MPLKKIDTGTLAEVDESEQLDVDEGEGVDASEGGVDDEDLEDIYNNPGELIEGDLA